jgi:GTP-binding protein HflX
MSHAESEAQREDVESVLAELGLDQASHPILEVHNKMDLVEKLGLSLPHTPPKPQLKSPAGEAAAIEAVRVSALTGEGIDRLLEAIEATLFSDRDVFDLVIPGEDGRGRAWVYQHAEVLQAQEDKGGSAHLMVRVSRDRAPELLRLIAAGGGEASAHQDAAAERAIRAR